MLYLVQGKLTRTWYMNDPEPEVDVIRLVEADNESGAIEKFTKYFESQTEEYAVYYHVSEAEASELIR